MNYPLKYCILLILLFVFTITSINSYAYTTGETVVKYVAPDPQTTSPAQSINGLLAPTFHPSTGFYSVNYGYKTVGASYTYWSKPQPYAIFYHCFNNNGTAIWKVSNVIYGSTYTAHTEWHDFVNALPKVSSAPASDECMLPSPCTDKAGQVNYKLQTYPNGTSYIPPASCYDGCKQIPLVLWSDCLNDNCIASVQYTYTGNSCTDEPGIDDLQQSPPPDCQDEIQQKIAQCGGSLNVLSFDYNTCTGECTPDSCQDQWAALLTRCGGIMGVSSWDAASCSGMCASDPVPQPSEPDEKPPQQIKETIKTNPDGSKEVTNSTTYYNQTDKYIYNTDTTTYYDSSGNQTGQTITTTKKSGAPEGSENNPAETFPSITSSGFGTAYNPGTFNIPTRFTQFTDNIKSSPLFSFSSSFFNSLPAGGSPVYNINAGQFGNHTIDLSQTMTGGLAVLKAILLVLFGFLSIRVVILKR